MTQTAHPVADIRNQGYTNQAGAAVSLYKSIDEVTASDIDYVQSADDPSADVYAVRLQKLRDPVSSAGHVLSYRYSKSDIEGSAIDLTVQIRQKYINEARPGRLIAEFTHSDIPDEPVTASQTLSAGQANAITNYGDLFVRFVFNQP